jgi:hypothetical protein
MKTLAIYMAYFRLPDNFSGSVSDALRMMADYHDQITVPPKRLPTIPLDTTLSQLLGLTFDEFLDAAKDGKRLVGLVRLTDFDQKVKISDL